MGLTSQSLFSSGATLNVWAAGIWVARFYSHQAISSEILRRFPATMELVLCGMFCSILIGIPVGVISAVKRNSLFDHLLRVITIAGVALATFWIGIELQLLFGYKAGIFPIAGRFQGPMPEYVTGFLILDTILSGDMPALFVTVKHLVLPTIALSIGPCATIVRFTRAGVLNTLKCDYVIYERGMGLSPYLLIYKYVLRNGITSTISQIGLLFGFIASQRICGGNGVQLARGGRICSAIYPYDGLQRSARGGHLYCCRLRCGKFDIRYLIDPRGSKRSGQMNTYMPWIREFFKDRLAVLGLIIILVFCLTALLAPYIAPDPHAATNMNMGQRLKAPSMEYWFGTDQMGRDIFSRVILGSRITLLVAITCIVGALLVGIPFGLIAGYYEGVVGGILMRICDIY